MMISALNDGRPSSASECWMWRRIWVGGKNGCNWDSRESGCDRSITCTGLLLSGHLLAHLDDSRDERGDDPLAGLDPGPGGVPDDARLGDVAEHVHRHDHARPARPHRVTAERGP